MPYRIMKKLFLLSSLFFIVFPFTFFGQINNDDLNKKSFDDLWDIYFKKGNTKKEDIKYASCYLKKAKKENNEFQIGMSYYLFALLYYGENIAKNEQNYNLAIQYLDSVIKYSKNSNDPYFPTVAYYEKGVLLHEQLKFKEAIDCYLLGEKSAIKNNLDYYYYIKNAIAIIKSENLGETEEALDLYKQCFNYYKTKDGRSERYSYYYQNMIFSLADAHKTLKHIDSATYYNKLGYKESKITNNKIYHPLFILNEGANQVLKENYKATIDSAYKALPLLKGVGDKGNILATYYYLGKAYSGLNNTDLAVKNYARVDSMYKATKTITPEFVGGYSYLIAYYRIKNNKEKQLEYMNTLLKIDSTFQKNYRELTIKIQNEYVIPNLVRDKENLISSLKSDKKVSYWGIGSLIIITIGLSLYAFYQNRKRKIYKERFERLVNNNGGNEQKENNFAKINENIVNEEKSKDIGVPEEVIIQTLERINTFESNKGYISSSITLQSLSEIVEVNTKYLSKIINTYKQKPFIQYINDLRIDEAVIQLQQDNDLKKYTISAIANEFGFNNAESFSSAFHKRTGLKPSFFIKELERESI